MFPEIVQAYISYGEVQFLCNVEGCFWAMDFQTKEKEELRQLFFFRIRLKEEIMERLTKPAAFWFPARYLLSE